LVFEEELESKTCYYGARLLSAVHMIKWGRGSHQAGHIRLNTELVKKPKDLVEYVVVHEMIHLMEPKHSDRFIAIMTDNYPAWREARAELNELPLAAEVWNE
jgi:predicted metal-dependent hydrolase